MAFYYHSPETYDTDLYFPESGDKSLYWPKSDRSNKSEDAPESDDRSFYCPQSDRSEFNATLSMGSNDGSLAMRSSSIRGCSSRSNGGSSSDKTYVAIFYPSGCDRLLIRVWVDSFLPALKKNDMSSLHNNLSHDVKEHYTHMRRRNLSEITKDFIDLMPTASIHYLNMFAICTSTVGALGPCIFLFQSSKEVFRYNLHEPHTGYYKCANMVSTIDDALSVQIGDFFYVLSFAGGNRPMLQKYDIQNDIWTLVQDNIITKCNCKDWYNLSMSTVPHVVINRKLHVSFGYNSFAFDTEKDIWEYSNLFQTFWLEHNKPSDFYGSHIWGMNQLGLEFSDQSFGFYRRAIVWDDDILLGFHYSSNLQLVAFQLLDNKAVKSQIFTLTDKMFAGVQLLDLGKGYFSLLHVTNGCCSYQLEMVTIVVSKPLQPQGDRFLDCQILRKDCVAENFSYNVVHASKAYCV